MLIATLALGAGRAEACLWVKGTTLEGSIVQHGGRPPVEGGRPVPPGANWVSGPDGVAAALKAVAALSPADGYEQALSATQPLPADWPTGLDEAVEPAFAGKPEEALGLLLTLHQAAPDNYWICADLAAATELAGDDAKALEWVEKALRLKPDAHYGTEWMHAAVLRGKLAMAKDPAWLETHTFSGIPLRGDVPADFTVQDGTRALALTDIHSALSAHLVPRLLFIKGKDRVVAALLEELARVEARVHSAEEGLAVLALAADYGPLREPGLQSRWTRLVKWTALLKNWWPAIAFLTAVVILRFWVIARRRRRWRTR